MLQFPPPRDLGRSHTLVPLHACAASQVSDGAAATLLMRRSTAKRLGLPVLGVFRSFAGTATAAAQSLNHRIRAVPLALCGVFSFFETGVLISTWLPLPQWPVCLRA